MKRIFVITTSLALCLGAANVRPEDNLSFGLGLGAPYAGIGANASWKSDKSFMFLAAGCVAMRVGDTGNSSACGGGLGWLRTDIISSAAAKHGVGVYLGPVSGDNSRSDTVDLKTIYGIGANYSYFTNGARQPGFMFSVTPALGRDGGKTDAYFLFGVGYQF